ncbi:MAG: formyltetrahydrofolate deformylase [Candidatus Margulisbacteria bacterium]|nr:formyltetrahydrofolate deformylase [Candidatus Margulisiibacteriota bacterium]
MKSMEPIILRFECPDQPGIIATLSTFLFKKGANILDVDQHSTLEEKGRFFCRIVFCFKEKGISLTKLETSFKKAMSPFKANVVFSHHSQKMRMGILASKESHCLADLLYRWQSGNLPVDIPFVISNHPDHQSMVSHFQVPYYYIPTTQENKKEAEILDVVKHNTDFLVLARYMQILSKSFLSAYGKDIINIHHSFLPSFPGANPYKQAFDRGVKIIGATAHFVTSELDAGPIISQEVTAISHRDSSHHIKKTGQHTETLALWRAVDKYVSHHIIRIKNKTIVF